MKFRSLEEIYGICNYELYVYDPITYDVAAKCKEWHVAMSNEMEANERNATWDLVDPPEGKNVIGLKWVFKTKYVVDESIQMHKARLMAKAYAQQQGVNFDETFSLVARFEMV